MLKTEQKNIRHLKLNELEEYFENIGEKKFRAKQVYEWVWQKGALSFADMTNLSKQLRQQLGETFTLPALVIDTIQNSTDGTIKSRFKTWDGHLVEGVLIPTASRYTACVSSQIGCSLSCKFCATGYMERKRNLAFDEIYDEVVLINQQSEKTYGKKLTNIVFMGMGEPLVIGRAGQCWYGSDWLCLQLFEGILCSMLTQPLLFFVIIYLLLFLHLVILFIYYCLHHSTSNMIVLLSPYMDLHGTVQHLPRNGIASSPGCSVPNQP